VTKVRSWAGLDVHAAKVMAASVDGESGELVVRRLAGDTAQVVAFCVGLPGPTRVAYEAGPTGFALARALEAAGVCGGGAGQDRAAGAGSGQDRPP
jgi:transposase